MNFGIHGGQAVPSSSSCNSTSAPSPSVVGTVLLVLAALCNVFAFTLALRVTLVAALDAIPEDLGFHRQMPLTERRKANESKMWKYGLQK
jgi:hypothetical protein